MQLVGARRYMYLPNPVAQEPYPYKAGTLLELPSRRTGQMALHLTPLHAAAAAAAALRVRLPVSKSRQRDTRLVAILSCWPCRPCSLGLRLGLWVCRSGLRLLVSQFSDCDVVAYHCSQPAGRERCRRTGYCYLSIQCSICVDRIT